MTSGSCLNHQSIYGVVFVVWFSEILYRFFSAVISTAMHAFNESKDTQNVMTDTYDVRLIEKLSTFPEFVKTSDSNEQ